jgi:hypothetical protein
MYAVGGQSASTQLHNQEWTKAKTKRGASILRAVSSDSKESKSVQQEEETMCDALQTVSKGKCVFGPRMWSNHQRWGVEEVCGSFGDEWYSEVYTMQHALQQTDRLLRWVLHAAVPEEENTSG